MTNKVYDLVVLGSGPAGEKGAAQAAYFGKSVALVEHEPVVGGACVNTGTIPSKTLRESALHLSGFKQRGVFGVDLALKSNITVADLMYRKDWVVASQHDQIERNLHRHHVDRYRGKARLTSSTEVAVDSSSGESQVLSARVILIATGSTPFRPPGVPFDHPSICDSDSILQIGAIPKRLAVVGAGVIGCEYASIFAALGATVSLIDGQTGLLGHIDEEIGAILFLTLRSRLNVDLHFGTRVEKLEPAEETVTLTLSDGAKIVADTVLYAAGRAANTSDLGLEIAGVETGKRGVIPVNERYQTSVPNIYAAGDVIGFPSLASTSMEQARVAMVHAFDLKYKTSIAKLLPYGIYTIPEISMIGKTEAECTKEGLDYGVGRSFFRNNPRGQIIGDMEGMLKLIFDAQTRKILGIHLIGENASELVHVGMMAMQFEGTIQSFIDSVFNYPTLGDVYKYAAYDGLGNLARRAH